MDKKSIGSFIAALRKSKGMTQQEVAEHLNVSNKTVSKWERDDGYPEITMIPALAELFDVTADEILRGERIREESNARSTVKVEKQIHWLINQRVTRFKNTSFLAMAIIIIGLNCMFTISYAAFRPLIGFGAMMALVMAGCVTELIAINGLHSSLRDNELVEEEHYLAKFSVLYRYAFSAFSLAVITVVLSLPLVIYRDSYLVESVLRFNEYLRMLPWFALLAGGIIFLGNTIVRKALAVAPRISQDQNKKLRALGKRWLLIMAVVLALTVAAQIAANFLMTLPIGQQFANQDEMAEFFQEAEQYQRSKEAAMRNGYVILMPNQVPPGQERVFIIQPQYENISSYDWEKLRVHYHHDYNTLAARRNAIAVGFRWIYLVEVVLVLGLYFRKKARLETL